MFVARSGTRTCVLDLKVQEDVRGYGKARWCVLCLLRVPGAGC